MILYHEKNRHGYFVTLHERPKQEIIAVNQIHGNEIIDKDSITSNSSADGIYFSDLITPFPTIVTADCIPVLLIGDNSYALIHAGWQGIQKKIVLKALEKVINPTTIILGPHIKVCCFEVTSPFKDNFPSSNNFKKQSTKLYFDLAQELIEQLGPFAPKVTLTNNAPCTCCNKDFHSYRRDKTEKRNWNLFIPSINIIK